MKKRHLAMATSLAVVAWLALFGDKSPASGKSEAIVRSASANPKRAEASGAVASGAAASQKKPAPEARIALIQSREVLVGGAGIEKLSPGLFLSQSWTPPPAPPPKPLPPPAPAPASAPALPFTYLGKKLEGGKWEIYLARGEQSYIVGEESAIDSLYRTGAIKAPLISIIYLPLNIVQTLNIGESE